MPVRSLYGQTAATLGVAFLVWQAIAMAIVVSLILNPLAKRSADDLAALIVLTAQTWVELPPGTRPAFEAELARNHRLRIRRFVQGDQDDAVHFVNSRNIQHALEQRTGQPVRFVVDKHGWVWVNLRMGGHLMHIGFEERRYYVHALQTAVGLISLAALLSWLTSLVLVRRISLRLQAMSLAAAKVGQGQVPTPLPEDGAQELASLGMAFNRMVQEVQELLTSRTTMLAGISHDLRTPLARMRLAVAMLPPETDSQLVGQLERDLEQMNHLIGEFLEMARGMQSESARYQDVHGLVAEVVDDARRSGARIQFAAGEPCELAIAGHALQRVLTNLLENAMRYGRVNDQPAEIEVQCRKDQAQCVIDVMDRGPGIPPDQLEAVFRPFHRLEQSRNLATGGSGLGLAIARQLAQANGWQLSLMARPEGGLLARLRI